MELHADQLSGGIHTLFQVCYAAIRLYHRKRGSKSFRLPQSGRQDHYLSWPGKSPIEQSLPLVVFDECCIISNLC